MLGVLRPRGHPSANLRRRDAGRQRLLEVGREAEIFKFVFKHSIALAGLVGAIVMLYAFAIPRVIPAVTAP